MDEPERPGPDADASEIAQWMEEHFEQSVDEGIINALEDNEEDPGDEGDGS